MQACKDDIRPGFRANSPQQGLGLGAESAGFRVSGFGFRVSGFGFRVSGFRFRVSGFRFRVSGFRFRVSGFGFRVSGFGFRVSGFGRSKLTRTPVTPCGENVWNTFSSTVRFPTAAACSSASCARNQRCNPREGGGREQRHRMARDRRWHVGSGERNAALRARPKTRWGMECVVCALLRLWVVCPHAGRHWRHWAGLRGGTSRVWAQFSNVESAIERSSNICRPREGGRIKGGFPVVLAADSLSLAPPTASTERPACARAQGQVCHGLCPKKARKTGTIHRTYISTRSTSKVYIRAIGSWGVQTREYLQRAEQ
jgi:hypothetical protein